MIEVLTRALEEPFKTKSNFAREHADLVAMAASDGFITTRVACGLYSRKWLITPTGLSHLYALTGRNHD
ncbi:MULTISPECIES: hypothetical protein [Agrobacterium]|jgi:hypothetical protein|uniref:Uncharacterized protein n=1 Tax=Agrobacterium pusense TaxID=648995 RepID=A0A6H0ZIF0_9HYPH|nr:MULTISPECIES: hypothetical protein [Agrobacterium]MDH0613344.1 hypothetical protein [Agrobacterium sp. GD03872]MDH0697261.1 hypothetical protein [Agrobacterium sp. GD03871]MDH1062194.1 hypothetical protein [Agrobacterium sp. GD03992]MDH2211368.1 hypothetical protein [Agrobacterium sp. GD03643]MDH2220627.1 hypothetical protein [Agrobacterium sp. GD03638]